MKAKKHLWVLTNKDSGNGSLRDAIEQANYLYKKRADVVTTILIKPAVGDQIKLTSGELQVASNIEIINQTNKTLTISAGAASQRIFNVSAPSQFVSIRSPKNQSIILCNGQSETNGGAINVTSTNHTLVLTNVTVCNNASAALGGGIFTLGRVTCIKCLVQCNSAAQQGGGIWSAQGVTLIESKIQKNQIVIADDSNGGGGVYVDNGDCLLSDSLVTHNQVAYDLSIPAGGSGGGIVTVKGTLYVQNDSHVDCNSAYNSAGIQQGIGNVYLTNQSSANANQSFNSATAAGGGGITITMGTVYLSHSEICDNRTVGMFSGGIVTLVGDVVLSNHSKIMRNTNRGPGGGIAVNIGAVTIDLHSWVCENTGASLGGGIVSFSPNGGAISVSGNSRVCNNTLTNAQTIAQTFAAFFTVISENLTAQNKQAALSEASGGGSGGKQLAAAIPALLTQLTNVQNALNALPIDQLIGPTKPGNVIAGGGIASVLSSEILIENSRVEHNFSGQDVLVDNSPFTALAGGIFGLGAKISLQQSNVNRNSCLSSGGGVWSGSGLNVSDSHISQNRITRNGNGGGIFNAATSRATLINSEITENRIAIGRGGGIYSIEPFIDYKTQIIHNKPDNVYLKKAIIKQENAEKTLRILPYVVSCIEKLIGTVHL